MLRSAATINVAISKVLSYFKDISHCSQELQKLIKGTAGITGSGPALCTIKSDTSGRPSPCATLPRVHLPFPGLLYGLENSSLCWAKIWLLITFPHWSSCFLLEPHRIVLTFFSFTTLDVLEARRAAVTASFVFSGVNKPGFCLCPPTWTLIFLCDLWSVRNEISFVSKPEFFKCRTPLQFDTFAMCYALPCLNPHNIMAPTWTCSTIFLRKAGHQYGRKNAELRVWKPRFIPDSASDSASDLKWASELCRPSFPLLSDGHHDACLFPRRVKWAPAWGSAL